MLGWLMLGMYVSAFSSSLILSSIWCIVKSSMSYGHNHEGARDADERIGLTLPDSSVCH